MEALLKVIIAPQVRLSFLKCSFDIDLRRVSNAQDPAEGFILNYTLLIGDASFSNFQKVCIETQVYLSRPLITMHLHLHLLYNLPIYLSIHPSINLYLVR